MINNRYHRDVNTPPPLGYRGFIFRKTPHIPNRGFIFRKIFARASRGVLFVCIFASFLTRKSPKYPIFFGRASRGVLFFANSPRFEAWFYLSQISNVKIAYLGFKKGGGFYSHHGGSKKSNC